MLSLKLFKFSKKPNSTKVPTGSGSNVASFTQVLLVEGTSVQNPIFHITTGPTTLTDYSRFNYAYCSTLARYYKIEETTWYPDGWRIRCSTDLLASLRSVIGASTQYITRSSAAYDGNIIDNFYQVKTDITYSKQAITAPWLQAVDAGAYIVGVVSPDPQFGSITYYVLEASSLAVLCQYLLTTAVSTQNNYSNVDASFALQKSLIDPFQYIKSCIYVPVAYNSITADSSFTSLEIWDWSIPSCPGKVLSKQHPQYAQVREFDLAKHPQTTDRGNWVNTSPYTEVELSFPPFGTITLDTSVTASNPHIYIDYRIDLISGMSSAWIYASADSTTTPRLLIGQTEAMCGIPIQLSQVTRDLAGAAVGFLGSVGSFASGNIVGGITGLVGSAIQARYPHAKSSGGNGTFYQLIFEAACYETFYPLIQEYNAYFGRPLCGPGTISNYAGYIETQGAVLTTGTSGFLASEIETTQEIMNGGFYYE